MLHYAEAGANEDHFAGLQGGVARLQSRIARLRRRVAGLRRHLVSPPPETESLRR